MRFARFSAAAIAACLAGCASTNPQFPPDKTFLTVVSQPAGAYITDMRMNRGGLSPQIYSYPTAQFKKDANGCMYVYGFDARWGSGATASTAKSIRMCPSEGNQFNLVVSRNPADPGLDKDLEFAARLDQQKQAAQAQRAAAQERREAAIIEGLAAGFAGAMDARAAAAAAAQQAQPQRVAPMRCTSTKVLGRVETECY